MTLERLIHNAIVLGITPTVTNLKSRAEIELENKVSDALVEYRLVKDGVTDYQHLGYRTNDGGVQHYKLLEYLAIDSAVKDAQVEREKREWQR